MLTKRIIPCLDVKRGRVVKGVKFLDHRDAGDPVEMASLYNEAGADELVFYDITASSDGRSIMLDVVSQVRADRDLKDTPIIAVTAFAMRGDAQRILEAGCDAYMSKPISIEPFRNTINALLDGNTSLPEPPKRHPFAVSVARQ